MDKNKQNKKVLWCSEQVTIASGVKQNRWRDMFRIEIFERENIWLEALEYVVLSSISLNWYR